MMARQRLTLLVLLGFAANLASAGQWRESPCVEAEDENGNTCTAYKRLQEETDCQELVDLIDGEVYNGVELHCHCACPEWYEPIPDNSDSCDAFSENKRCPEQFDSEIFDYHPLGDDDQDTCLKICSNMPGGVCCLFRNDGKCYSHRLGASLDFSAKSGANAAICNLDCPVQFDVTLYDDGEDGWGDYSFNIQTSETGVELSEWVKHTKNDVYKSTHSICVRQETPCYTAVAVPRGAAGDADQAAQLSFEVELDGVLVGVGNASYFPHFGMSDGHACPSRLYKRLGRYALKEFEKVGSEYLDATKAYRNIARKADKLGVFTRPVKKMGAVWPEDADWVPTTTTTTDPFGIGDTTSTTTTTTVTYFSDESVLVDDGTSCGDNGHCSIQDIDSCEAEAIKWGLPDTAASAISKAGTAPGCQLTSASALRFNDVIAGNGNSPADGMTLICRLCTITTTTEAVTTTTTEEATTTTTKKETTEEPVRTIAPTTEDAGRNIPAPSPYEIITDGYCYQYGLCRVADEAACDEAADSLNLQRTADISKAAKPGGCLVWSTGAVKFNDQLDSGVASVENEAMVICYECEDFKAPAPSFTRKATTEEITRKDATTEEPRVVTTEHITRKVTKKDTTNRHIDYVTKDAGVERCRPDYCALESLEECQAAAIFTGQADTKAATESKSGKAAGCYVNVNGVLRFNSKFFTDDAGLVPNLKVGSVGETHLCEVCAPAPSPARPDTTEVVSRGDVTTKAIVRTDADTTEQIRTTTDPDARSYYYTTEQRATAYDLIIDTERPDEYETQSTTKDDRGNYDSVTTTQVVATACRGFGCGDTTTGRGGGGGGDTTTGRGGGGGGDTTTGRGGGGGDTTTGRGGGGGDTTTGRGGDSTTGRGGGNTNRGGDTTTTGRGGGNTNRGGDTTTDPRGGGGQTNRGGSTTRGSTSGAGRGGSTTTTGRPAVTTTGRSN